RRDNDGGETRRGFPAPQLFVRAEEEHAAGHGRPAQRSAKVVALKLREFADEIERLRVETLVAIEFEERTVQLGGARLGHDVALRARAAVRGGKLGRLHLKLGNGLAAG